MPRRPGRTRGEQPEHEARAHITPARRTGTAEDDSRATTPALERGDCVVCIALVGPHDQFALCLQSVVANTPAGIAIQVVETLSSDPGVATIVRDVGAGRAIVRVPAARSEPTASLSSALAALAPADVLLVRSDCVVGENWYAQLRNAAYSASHVASASALSNDAGILSMPERNVPNRLPAQLTPAQASAAVAARAARVYPRLPLAAGRATYLRREALDLAGGLDPALAALEAAVVDFSQRCIASGLVHVAADDTYVYFHSPGKLAPDESLREREATEDRLVNARYPFLSAELVDVEREADRPLPAALARGSRALCGMSVTLDGRSLVAPSTGTQGITLETIRSLAALDTLALRVVVPHDLAGFAREALSELDVVLVEAGPALSDLAPSSVVHRPFQISSSADLDLLSRLGERLVVSHLDLIAYDNPSYFPTVAHWQHYRRVTRIGLAMADRVAFVSRDAAADALAEQLVEPEQAVVVYQGVTHSYAAPEGRERPPEIDRLAGRDFMVQIGADFHHKNRVFALELLAAMQREHGWPGGIVFAGPRAAHGSSAGEEARFIAANPDIADSVVSLEWVSEPAKAWLIENSVAVCLPSTREGFGLMPFEAAAYGRPCIFASTTALAELQPPGVATIVPWDARESASRVLELLGDPAAREAHIARIRERALELTWQASAEHLIDVYEDALSAPSREARRIAHDLSASERDRAEIHRKYDELWNGLSADGHALTGVNGLLDAEDQRALLIVAGRGWLRRLVLGQARLLQRLTRKPTPLAPPPTTDPELFDMHFRESNVNHMRQHLLAENDPADMH